MIQCLAALSLIVLCLSGCTTNDLRIVDALGRGMSKADTHAVISDFGYQCQESLMRPEDGWSSIKTMTRLPERALEVESRLESIVSSAEYYPVSGGMLGYGELFLFYNPDDQLMDFYRVDVN